MEREIEILCIVDMYMASESYGDSLIKSLLFGTLHEKRRFIMGNTYFMDEQGNTENELGEGHIVNGSEFFKKHFLVIKNDNDL